jgi:poly(3-hydroxybutyrate) depolymerase
LDDISGSGQTRSAIELCSGIPNANKEEYEVLGAGHYGIFAGRRWRELVYPKISEFIRKHPGTPEKKAAAQKITVTSQKLAPKKAISSKTAVKRIIVKTVPTKSRPKA